MNKGIKIYGTFNILFGSMYIFYGISIFAYYFLKSLQKQNSELLNEKTKHMLLDPCFLFFNIPYAGQIYIVIGIILLFFGAIIIYFNKILNNINKNKKIINHSKNIIKKELNYIEIILNLFIIKMSLLGITYIIRTILLFRR